MVINPSHQLQDRCDINLDANEIGGPIRIGAVECLDIAHPFIDAANKFETDLKLRAYRRRQPDKLGGTLSVFSTSISSSGVMPSSFPSG